MFNIEVFRDEIVEDSKVYDWVKDIVTPLNSMFDNAEVVEDSLISKNNRVMDVNLDRIATKISRRLIDDVSIPNHDKFMMHYDVTIKQLKGKRGRKGDGKVNSFLPYTLVLSDGQVLTALIRNTNNQSGRYHFSGSEEVEVARWALNNKDITTFIYLKNKKNIDSSVIASRLAKIINAMHRKFVSKNPNASLAIELEKKLDKIKINFNNIVWQKPEPKEEKPKVKEDIDLKRMEQYEEILRKRSIPFQSDHINKTIIIKTGESTIIIEKGGLGWSTKITDIGGLKLSESNKYLIDTLPTVIKELKEAISENLASKKREIFEYLTVNEYDDIKESKFGYSATLNGQAVEILSTDKDGLEWTLNGKEVSRDLEPTEAIKDSEPKPFEYDFAQFDNIEDIDDFMRRFILVVELIEKNGDEDREDVDKKLIELSNKGNSMIDHSLKE